MKKVICVALCFVVLGLFAGCKEEKKETTHDVDIAYFANMGAMPESDLKLGDSIPEITEEMTEWFSSTDGKNTFVTNGEFYYYYDEGEKDPKIKSMAAFSKGMGFEIGAISIEVTKALDSQDVKYKTRDIKANEIDFLPAAEGRETVECEGLKHNLIFVFEENALCAIYMD